MQNKETEKTIEEAFKTGDLNFIFTYKYKHNNINDLSMYIDEEWKLYFKRANTNKKNEIKGFCELFTDLEKEPAKILFYII